MPVGDGCSKAAASEAECLYELAQDYDRWGLAEQAESTRSLYRAAMVRSLASRAGARLASLSRPAKKAKL